MSKPCAFKGHPLVSHMEGSLKIVRVLIDEGYQHTISSRLVKALGGGVDSVVLGEIARDMIEISVIFHDVGKALKAYQDLYDDACSCKDRCGFQYHEIFSALYLYRFLLKLEGEFSKLYGSGLVDPMIMIPVMSVANHMHAMRSYGELKERICGEDLARIIKRGAYIEQAYAEKLSREILRLKDTYYGVRVSRSTIELKVESKDGWDCADIKEMINHIDGASKHRWSKLYLLVLVPLSIGDNCDSVAKRISDAQELPSRRAYIRELCCNSSIYYRVESGGYSDVCGGGVDLL